MAQHEQTATLPTAVAHDPVADAAHDPVSIFSAAGLEAVFQWWAESKQRWAERDGADALLHPAVVKQEAR